MAWYASPGVVLTSLVLAGGAVGVAVSDDSVEVLDTIPAQETFMEEDVFVPTFVPEPIISQPYAVIEEEGDEECHPSYSGCLNPNASDYDCAGGSGNGPYYTGSVQVYGYDEYGLDRDGNGWGCE